MSSRLWSPTQPRERSYRRPPSSSRRAVLAASRRARLSSTFPPVASANDCAVTLTNVTTRSSLPFTVDRSGKLTIRCRLIYGRMATDG